MDRRWIYLAFTVVVLVSLCFGHQTKKPIILPPVQQLYDSIDAVKTSPADQKIVLLSMTISAGSKAENWNQARAIMRHLMLRHQRFAVFSFDTQGVELTYQMAADIAKHYGYQYGKDWIHLGYALGTTAFFKGISTNLPDAFGNTDVNQHALAQFPIMKGIKTANNLAMLVEITATPSLGDWLGLVQPATKPRIKIGYACTGISAAEAYQYLDSGQICGLLPGLKGASDYETLVDNLEIQLVANPQQRYDPKAPTTQTMPATARVLMFPEGMAHILVIILIILGNIGLLLSRRRARISGKDISNG
jgi:hypothetical protein